MNVIIVCPECAAHEKHMRAVRHSLLVELRADLALARQQNARAAVKRLVHAINRSVRALNAPSSGPCRWCA